MASPRRGGAPVAIVWNYLYIIQEKISIPVIQIHRVLPRPNGAGLTQEGRIFPDKRIPAKHIFFKNSVKFSRLARL
jgi:hypothetical protein